ncbi:SUF system Fe-S cluster assembly regulator [Lysobacteraceae bacterium NML75-0749]|nr:SUF system Fe-S cluster assembly regulator [Xanthomonadaceae bacterium NML91-0268]PJK03187.1 SUF system Fe-S cluster assembly regulator [Xanthomonadaceae bacterium NML75-0749]
MLRVTKLTDYATLVMSVLAAAPDVDAVLSAAELAERAGIELPTASKVLKPLAAAGLVQGFRGANGGYRLARDPHQISLADIVTAMEGPLAMTECSIDHGHCELEPSCHLRSNWQRINAVVAEALAAVSLYSMLPGNTPPTAEKRIPLRLSA